VLGAFPPSWHDESDMPDNRRLAITAHEFAVDPLWEKLRRFARRAGRVVVERVLRLYYASQDPRTPRWAKRTIYAGLAYFILPLDFVPDILPGIGFTDDAATLLMTLTAVSAYVHDDVKVRARTKVADWFGEP
jgi:uncharacterized membrane protein YkvA (DUF1232 family)